MNCEQANKIDIVDFLASIGKHPVRPPKNNKYWYISPYRDEHTASFRVKRNLNTWKDYGSGEWGSLVDLGMKIYGCDVSKFLEILAGTSAGHSFQKVEKKPHIQEDPAVKIIKAGPIASPALFYYLKQRAIPSDIARQYLEEVKFEIYGKQQYALGFKNRSGGYELRNSYFKGSSLPKDIFYHATSSEVLAVFEGFFDFLSFIANQRKNENSLPSMLVMNSTSLFDLCLPYFQKHPQVDLYFDNDTTGKKFTEILCGPHYTKGIYNNRSYTYAKHKDYNEWWEKVNSPPRKIISKGFRL